MSNIDAILAAAKAQAETLPAVAAPAAGAVQTLQPIGGSPVGYNMSLDSFLDRGGMECETYIQVKDAGIKLNKDWGGYIEEFEAILVPADAQQFMGIRKEVGSNTSYAKTYDGVTTSRGENFAQTVEEFRGTSQKPADPYPGFDIPLTLVGDYADPRDKNKKYEDGTRVGLTTSITGFKPAAQFIKKIRDAGFLNQAVKVKVKHSPRRNAAGQDYGVCDFELIEVLGAAGDAAAA